MNISTEAVGSVQLSADPFSLNRQWPTVDIPIEMIRVRGDVASDPIFVRKYADFLLGNRPAYVTRVRIEKIMPGFYIRSDSGFEQVIDEISAANLTEAIEAIRSGDRPALHLYRNPNAKDPNPYVCADDVVYYQAYSSLGIRTVPAVLLDKVDHNVDEAYVVIECVCSRDGKNHYSYIADIASPKREKVASILWRERYPELRAGLGRLIEVVEEAKERVKAFHQSSPKLPAIHYHHTIYSVLLRTLELLSAVDTLVEAKQFVPAVPLARSLYELSLTFYIDWVAPRELYRFFQLACAWRDRDISKFCNEVAQSKRKKGFSDSSSRRIKIGLNRAFMVASRVSEKGKLSPFGSEFHSDFYAFMSEISHQNFSVTARYKHTLDQGDVAIFDEDIGGKLIRVCDLAVAAIISRINQDISE